MSYTPASSGSILPRSGRLPSRISTMSSASSIWSKTGRDNERMSILAKPASATLSLFQSMMNRPSMAPALMGTISGMGELLSTMPSDVLAQPLRSVHELRGEIEQVPPAGGIHPVPEVRQLGHLVPQVRGVMGVQPASTAGRGAPWGRPSALPRSWMMPFTL